MKKVLYLEPSGNMWGSERSLVLLLTALDVRRFKAALCLPANSPLQAVLRTETNVRLLPWLPSKFNKESRWSRIHAFVGLFAVALVSRAPIIHLNQAGFVRLAVLVARLLGRALVIHVRLAEDAELVARRVKCWRRVRCIANSKFVAEELKAHRVPPEKIIQITNPIEMSAAVMAETVRCWQMGFVGRLSQDKGIEHFLRACQRVMQARPATKVVVVGSSGGKTAEGRDYLEAMRDLAAELGIADKVEFLGFRKDVPELMGRMEVFVMASEAEPWGRVVAEAMVAGAAVVANDSGGPKEMIQHGTSGLLVKPGDDAEMAGAVLQLLENPGLARKFAAAGRKWVELECDPARHARRVEEVYEEMLKN